MEEKREKIKFRKWNTDIEMIELYKKLEKKLTENAWNAIKYSETDLSRVMARKIASSGLF